MKKYTLYVITTSIIALLASVLVAHAQGYTPLVTIPGVTEAGKPVELTSYLVNMMRFLIAGAGALAIVLLVVAGTKYVASGIAPSAKNDAKDQITSALIGLGLVLTSYLILNTINPDLVNFRLALEEAKGSKPAEIPLEAATPVEYPNDSYERNYLASGTTIRVNKDPCLLVSQKNCTSIHGLRESTMIKLRELALACGTSCTMMVTGGTEYWLHGNRKTNIAQNGTYHKPYPEGGELAGKTVDLSKNSAPLNSYIMTKGEALGFGKACATGNRWRLDGGIYVDEVGGDPHWHVCYY